jgi:pyrrolidone-carboxylate peptidase
MSATFMPHLPSLTRALASLRGRFHAARSAIRAGRAQRAQERLAEAEAQAAYDDRYSQREFIQEIMARNPDAFASDLDVEAFLQYCPR